MSGTRSDARKRIEEIPAAQVAASAPLLLLDDVRRALECVYPHAGSDEASALLDQLETCGLRVVREGVTG